MTKEIFDNFRKEMIGFTQEGGSAGYGTGKYVGYLSLQMKALNTPAGQLEIGTLVDPVFDGIPNVYPHAVYITHHNITDHTPITGSYAIRATTRWVTGAQIGCYAGITHGDKSVIFGEHTPDLYSAITPGGLDIIETMRSQFDALRDPSSTVLPYNLRLVFGSATLN